jgi:hypothetical protein
MFGFDPGGIGSTTGTVVATEEGVGVGVGVGVGSDVDDEPPLPPPPPPLAETVMVMLEVVAFGEVPLAACTVKVNDPAVVGVPDSTPLVLSVKPVGSEPVALVNVIGVEPDAVNV